MKCYTYEHAQCHNPVFKHVTHAVILRMDTSSRSIAHLLGLCAVTIVQSNRGYKACTKRGVSSTPRDLLHAYTAACKYTRDLGHVLIMEDDAEFMQNTRDTHIRDVDEFVYTHAINAYTLGSLGDMYHHQATGNHYMMTLKVYAQAIIWSAGLRHELLSMVFDHTQEYHIDAQFLKQRKRIFTYTQPLIVQKLQPTENQTSWCITCKPDHLSQAIDHCWRDAARRWIQHWNLDISTDAWSEMYDANKSPTAALFFYLQPWATPASLLLVAVIITVIFVNIRVAYRFRVKDSV